MATIMELMKVPAEPPLLYIRNARTQAREAGHEQLVSSFDLFENFYGRRLWHQLSVEMERFIAIPESVQYLIRFYCCFVRDFEKKLNKLSLVAGIGLAVARQLPERNARIEFLLYLANSVCSAAGNAAQSGLPTASHAAKALSAGAADTTDVDSETMSAQLFARAQAAYYQLMEGQFELVSQWIREAERQLNKLENVDPRVSCAFYKVAADCYKARAEYAKFYHTSLLFFSCLSASNGSLPPAEAEQQVRDLSLAVLLSPEIYNFGELLTHPILEHMHASPNAWLAKCLLAFNHGDLAAYETFAASIALEPLLASKAAFLREKISLMALVEFSFNLTVSARMLGFKEIAARVGMAINDVEMLVMKAMSLDLLRGSIDQVRQCVCVTWVAPRVLDRTQIGGLCGLLETWHGRVQQAREHLSTAAGELFG